MERLHCVIILRYLAAHINFFRCQLLVEHLKERKSAQLLQRVVLLIETFNLGTRFSTVLVSHLGYGKQVIEGIDKFDAVVRSGVCLDDGRHNVIEQVHTLVHR